MGIEVIKLNAGRDLCWSFEGDQRPFFRYQNADYTSHEYVDPFPAYSHDFDLVTKHAEFVSKRFPIPQPVTFYLLDREGVGRTNGYTNIGYFYDGEKDSSGVKPWSASIILSGKRIPPLPAMTRYLVSHEYGHAVAKYLRWKHGYGMDEGKFYAEYAEKRGLDCHSHYGGGTWHLRTEEVVANDFRILITGDETDFWPHTTVPHPNYVPYLGRTWSDWQSEAQAALTEHEIAK